jgi:hypothetical protein
MGGISPNPRVVYRDLAEEDGGVLLHLDTGQYHGVNRVGSLIWHLLDGERNPTAIAQELQERVDAAPAALEQDVARFLAHLRKRDLVVE